MDYFFVDESGCGKQWVFLIIKVSDRSIVDVIIKKWRKFMRNSIGKGFDQNEYKDHKAKHRERKRILTEIGKCEVKFWAIINKNYEGHKKDYVE